MSMINIPKQTKPSIFIIGAGGTGGFAFTNLTRLFAGTDIPIHIYDGDVVEPKNLKRQMFTKDDVDVHKSTALKQNAEATILDCQPIMAYNDYIVDADSLLADILINTEVDGTAIIISAVDNVATRLLINECVSKCTIPYVHIDSGNNNQGGQVVFTTSHMVEETRSAFESPTRVQLANMFETYPELNTVKDDNPGVTRSCGDVVESEPQAMMANSRNGDIIANIVMTLVNGGTLPGNVYESNLTTLETKSRTTYA